MDEKTAIRLMQAGGAFFIIAGILLIGFYSTIEYIGPLYGGLGALLILFGLIWIVKVRNAARKRKIMKKMKSKPRSSPRAMYALIYLLLLTSGFMMQAVGYLQTYSRQCYVMYQRVVYVEYFLLGLLIISGFLAFAPVILGRTILGPILQELQYIAGAMLILLIFALLVVFPLDPMFVMDNPKNPTACYVDLRRLEAQGPPFLQILLRLFSPPPPTFS